MTFKTKLFSLITATTLVATASALYCTFRAARQNIWGQARAKVLSVAATGALQVSGDDIEAIHKNPDARPHDHHHPEWQAGRDAP